MAGMVHVQDTDSSARAARDATLTDVVDRAAQGDDDSWEQLIRRFGGLIRAVARSCGLSHADASEVEQVTWLRLAEHIETIGQPERLGAWLATTTRRESWKDRRRGGRYVYTDDVTRFDGQIVDESPLDTGLLEHERMQTLSEALRSLPERQRLLLSMLLEEPDISYGRLSEALDMPIGSIGPTRARAVLTLRRHLTRAGLDDAD